MTEIIRSAAVAPAGGSSSTGGVRAVVVGTIVGFVLVGGFCGGVALVLGARASGAAALAAFTGFWGGPGFGGMMGFVLHQSRVSDRAVRPTSTAGAP